MGIEIVEATRSGAQPIVDERDLLLIVDDSISMSDKQAVLQQSLRQLRTVPSACSPPVDDNEHSPQIWYPPQNGRCPDGWSFRSLITVRNQAVISTSMEAGGEACATTSKAAHPLPSVGQAEEQEQGTQYLAQLQHVGERGCGYEAPLEAMYRFLIDPEPPLSVTTSSKDGVKVTIAKGLDSELLAAREAFLAPLSQLIIVILTDEDDCSISDRGEGWKVGDQNPAARPTSACDDDPSDECCRPCDATEMAPPAGCSPLKDDAGCMIAATWSVAEDPLNLRCFDRKRRFGRDALFPLSRYVDGLREASVPDRHGKLVPNPLFAHGRTPDMVSVLVLGGTPWQDISSQESQGPRMALEFFTPAQLEEQNVWSRILGNPKSGVAPTDVRLVSSAEPRPGLPLANSSWDAIIGHEVVRPTADELQYSCIFELPEVRPCVGEECPCGNEQALSPLCRTDDGMYDTTQRRAQAYPAPRLLEFVRELHSQAFLGSVCPKELGTTNSDGTVVPGFGYADAFLMMARETYQSAFNSLNCFQASFPLAPDGRPECSLLEMHEGSVDCTALGRAAAPEKFAQRMREVRHRDDSSPNTICEILPFAGSYSDPQSDAYKCANDLHPELDGEGYCYIDPTIGLGSERLVDVCAAGHQRRLRVIPQTLPVTDTMTELYCNYPDGT